MLHLLNNTLIFLCAFLTASCGFVDLRPIGFSIVPEKSNSLLAEPFSPVIIKFDTEMEKNTAEAVLQINSDLGVVPGDRFWKDNHLYFVPVAGWTAGVRHTLTLSGTIRAVDGRELRLEHFVSFFAINKNNPPMLEWFFPPDGASTGTGGIVPEFRFTRSMERLSVESALTIDGIANKVFEWSDSDRTLKIFPEKELSAWTLYRWNLRESAKSRDGVPLPKAYSAQFTTNLDQNLPTVEKVFPVLFSGGQWHWTGAKIENGLGTGQGVAVEFSKPMGENVLRSMRFEPSLSGRIEFLSENMIVYIFTGSPEPETTYTLIVSGDTRDNEGLKIGDDYRINFTPDIPFLKVLSFTIDGNQAVTESFSAQSVLTAPVDQSGGELFFTIYFSLPFSEEEKQNAALRISLTAHFPGTIAPAALQYVNWISNDRLRMCWEGLEAGNSEEPHYYKLTIPGGRGGINAGTETYMKEDINIFLEAVNGF